MNCLVNAACPLICSGKRRGRGWWRPGEQRRWRRSEANKAEEEEEEEKTSVSWSKISGVLCFLVFSLSIKPWREIILEKIWTPPFLYIYLRPFASIRNDNGGFFVSLFNSWQAFVRFPDRKAYWSPMKGGIFYVCTLVLHLISYYMLPCEPCSTIHSFLLSTSILVLLASSPMSVM